MFLSTILVVIFTWSTLLIIPWIIRDRLRSDCEISSENDHQYDPYDHRTDSFSSEPTSFDPCSIEKPKLSAIDRLYNFIIHRLLKSGMIKVEAFHSSTAD